MLGTSRVFYGARYCLCVEASEKRLMLALARTSNEVTPISYRDFAELFLKPPLVFRNVELEERTRQSMPLGDYNAK